MTVSAGRRIGNLLEPSFLGQFMTVSAGGRIGHLLADAGMSGRNLDREPRRIPPLHVDTATYDERLSTTKGGSALKNRRQV